MCTKNAQTDKQKSQERLKQMKDGEPAKCYIALILQKYEGNSIEKIASEIGKTQEATRQFLSRCRKKIKEGSIKRCFDECTKD